jgi:hypothetical protein
VGADGVPHARGRRRPYALFDLDSTQEAASATPVMLDQYIYGGLGLRGHRQWASGAQFLTSEGRTRANGDGSNARWTHIGGDVDGKPAGYAVLCHPDNFRAPQPVRLNPSDPVLQHRPGAAERLHHHAGQAVPQPLPRGGQRRRGGQGTARPPVERLRHPARRPRLGP